MKKRKTISTNLFSVLGLFVVFCFWNDIGSLDHRLKYSLETIWLLSADLVSRGNSKCFGTFGIASRHLNNGLPVLCTGYRLNTDNSLRMI